MIRIIIECDPQTGALNMSGPLHQTLLIQGILAEARRIVEQMADERDADARKGKKKADLIIVPSLAGLKA